MLQKFQAVARVRQGPKHNSYLEPESQHPTGNKNEGLMGTAGGWDGGLVGGWFFLT